MQTLSHVLVLLMQQPVAWAYSMYLLHKSGIISSWILKAYLKAGKGEKLGSFWNISMLRNYIATIGIDTTGTLGVLTAPDTYTEVLKQSNQSPSWCSNWNHILEYMPPTHDGKLLLSGETDRGEVFVSWLAQTLVLHKQLNKHHQTLLDSIWSVLLCASSSVSEMGGGTKLICSSD